MSFINHFMSFLLIKIFLVISVNFGFNNGESSLIPRYLVVNGLNNIYPGFIADIEIILYNESYNEISINQIGYDISFAIINADLNINQEFKISYLDGKQDMTLIIPSSSSIQFGSEYIMDVKTHNSTLIGNSINSTVIECPQGFGIDMNEAVLECHECTGYTFKVTSGLYDCINCENNEGIECNGGVELKIDNNYWLNHNLTTNKLITAICPPNICCLKAYGCSYVNDTDKLCAKNRDINSLLCSQCMDGYSELYGSNECGVCTENNFYILSIPYAYTLLLAVYFVFVKSYRIPTEQKIIEIMKDPKKIVLNDNFRSLPTMIFTIVTYYNQLFSDLLLYGNMSNNTVSAYMALFSLSFNANNSNGFCLFANMDAHYELLTELIFPVMLLINIAIVLPIFSMIFRIFRCKKCEKLTHPPILNAFLNGLLICLGTIVSVFFKLIKCIDINDVEYHFYYAYQKCYDIWWFISAIILPIIVIILMIGFIVTYRMDKKIRNNPQTNKLFKLVKPYKPSIYYYEFIYVSRRLIIGVFVFTLPKHAYLKYSLCIILVLYLIIQIKLNPFLYPIHNILETACITLLIFIYVSLSMLDRLSIQYLILILLVIPWTIIIYWIIKSIYNICYFDDNPIKLEAMVNRMIRKDTSIKDTNSQYNIQMTNETQRTDIIITDDNEQSVFVQK